MNFNRTLLTLAVSLSLAGLARAEEAKQQSGDFKLEPIQIGTPERIEVLPPAIKLDTNRRQMRILVSGFYAGGLTQDLTRVAELSSSDPKVAAVHGGIVFPVGDGKAEITVKVGGKESKLPVEVLNFAKADPLPFEFGVLVALNKANCSTGACHGSPSGKGGFRLSLRGYDPVLDQETLIREVFNRRTNVMNPDASLLLQKPLMQVPHGGGRRLGKDSVSHQMLRTWIAEGMQLDTATTPRCVKVEVFPKTRVLERPAHTQQLLVLATFADGTVRDITRVACYSSSDEAVATVDDEGFVIGHDRGETAVLVRYMEHMETSYLMFLKNIENFQWTNPPEANFVDKLVFDKLKKMQILPSDIAGEEEFVRRVYLDVIGLLPTPEEAQKFLADTSPDKRNKLIDELLERPEYAEFWSLRWGDLLRVNNKQVTSAGVHKFRRWILAQIRDNKPYDQFVRELLTAAGSTFDNPPANYFRTAGETNDCTETTSQVFLGIRIQCAKCHNHPFERWTQDNYYGIGAFFNRVQRKKTDNPEEMVVWIARGGEITQPRTGKQMKPWMPLKGDADLPAEDDRREALMTWLTSADNPFFPQAEVNRLWGYLIGRGIVEPVDDFRASNPPSNEPLLAALSAEFVKSGFDRKHILKTILKSRTYQLSSKKNDFNKDDVKYFSHARTRLLGAEQLLDAICQVTGVSEKYAGLPAGTRATQLPSPDVNNYFLKVFGQPPREMACACERSSESNLSQALQMINGPLVHGKLRDGNNRLQNLIKAKKTDAEIIEELYLAALARKPTPEEVGEAAKYVSGQPDRTKALEDVCWAMLNAKEFLFQH